MEIRELNSREIEAVSGADIGTVGAGIATVGLSILIVSNPVGLVGLGAATALAYAGGTMIGDGATGGDIWSS